MNNEINEMLKNSGIVTQQELNESVEGKIKRHIRKLDQGKIEINKIMKNMNQMLINDFKDGLFEGEEEDIPVLVKKIHGPLITVEKGLERLIKRLRKLEIQAHDAKTKEDKKKILNQFKNETDKDRTLSILLRLMKQNKKALKRTNIFTFFMTLCAVIFLVSMFIPGLVGAIGAVGSTVGVIAGGAGAVVSNNKAVTSSNDFNMFMQIINDFPIVALKNFFVSIKEVKTSEEGERLATKLEKHLEKVA
jgi:hypothetical protein